MLDFLHIVLMRPQAKAIQWQTLLSSQRAQSTVLPMIEIVPTHGDSLSLQSLKTADQIIISSQHAIQCASKDLILALSKMGVPIYTMGASITQALAQYDIEPIFTAPIGSQSEDLLNHPELQKEKIFGKSMVLLIGKGGRTLIAKTLIERGAKVTPIQVYEQRALKYNMDEHLENWRHLNKQIGFVVTSGNILDNFIQQIPKAHVSWLLQQPLIVISQRLVNIATEYGFKHIIHSNGTDWFSLLRALHTLKRICHTSANA